MGGGEGEGKGKGEMEREGEGERGQALAPALGNVINKGRGKVLVVPAGARDLNLVLVGPFSWDRDEDEKYQRGMNRKGA